MRRGRHRRASASVIGRYYAMDRDRRWDRIAARLRPARPRPRRAPRRRAAPRRPRAAYERGETDEFIAPTAVGDEARIRPGDSVARASTSAPTACARSRARWPSPASTEIDRGGAPPVARYATMTEYEEGWPYPVAFPPERPAIDAARRCSPTRGVPPAARRRDREVPARHVLLQRRRGDAVRRRASASSCPRRATCRPTTTSPR